MYSSTPRGLPEQKPEYYGPMIIEAMDTNAVNSSINTKLDTEHCKEWYCYQASRERMISYQLSNK